MSHIYQSLDTRIKPVHNFLGYIFVQRHLIEDWPNGMHSDLIQPKLTGQISAILMYLIVIYNFFNLLCNGCRFSFLVDVIFFRIFL